MELRYNLGSGTAVLTSSSTLTLGEWHTIEATRTGRSGQLVVDGAVPVTGSSPGGFTSLQLGENLFIGGVPDFNSLPSGVINTGFVGCMRELRAASSSVNLTGAAIAGANIGACPVGPCFQQPCLNGGSCAEVAGGNFSCSCPAGWTGQRCESAVAQCQGANPCQNGGQCRVRLVGGSPVEYCNCSLPYGGDVCSDSELTSGLYAQMQLMCALVAMLRAHIQQCSV